MMDVVGVDVGPVSVSELVLGLADVSARVRACEVEQVVLVGRLADAYGVVDGPTSCGVPGPQVGGERLVSYGGEGTPEVAEFVCHEVGPALGVSPVAAAHVVGDVLDLRHRLPRLWVHVRNGHVRVWVARKVAQVTRRLPVEAVDGVDRLVAPFAPGWTPGRLVSQVERLVALAEGGAGRSGALAGRRVRFAPDGQGCRSVWAVLDGGPALDLEATIDQLADRLVAGGAVSATGGRLGREEARARGLELLADPVRAAQVLDPGILGPAGAEDSVVGDAGSGVRGSGVVRPRPVADLEIRLDATMWDQAIAGGTCAGDGSGAAGSSALGVVVVGLGVVFGPQLAGLLAGRRVRVRPVVDTRVEDGSASYRPPESMRARVVARSEAPQVLRRSYTGCGSRMRAA